MLHVTVIILLCCAVSAPSEGIAVTRRKNYLFEGFCLFEEKVPKVAEVSSSSFYNVDDDQFPDCLKHKITYRLSFFNNFYINQCQSRKNNCCSIMDSVLERKKKNSDSSVELSYRKRNLLWTQKGLQSLKTLKPQDISTTTTPLPLEKHTLNYIEKKRFFTIKKRKKLKKIRVRRHALRRHPFFRQQNSKEEIFFSEPARQLSNVILNDYFEEKLQERGRAFPRNPYWGKFNEFKKNRGHRNFALNNYAWRRQSAGGEVPRVSYWPRFRHCHNLFTNRYRENDRVVGEKSLSNGNGLLNPDFDPMGENSHAHTGGSFIQRHRSKKIPYTLGRFQTHFRTHPSVKNYISSFSQLIYDSRIRGNNKMEKSNSRLHPTTESADSNEYEDFEVPERGNKEERNRERDDELEDSETDLKTKSAVPNFLTEEEETKIKQEMEDIFRKILKSIPSNSADLSEGFNSAEELNEPSPPESTINKPFLSRTKMIEEIPITDFDYPDYDDTYDAAADTFLKSYPPLPPHKMRKFKLQNNVLAKRRFSKFRQRLRSDPSCPTPMNLKRSLLFKKSLEREKKFCGSRCSKCCEAPYRCWKSAPLLCIPYIRKGQDDLLKYLIGVMQKMLGKPYPQKIDIFENTKFKPSIKKVASSSCEDIIPHDTEDDKDDDENCQPNSCKNAGQSYEPYSHQYTGSSPSCPNACSPVPTACSSCPKGCSKNSNEPSCPSFPCPLPNLNQIYTEPTPCSSEKCFSTLPPFLIPLSSIIQAGAKKTAAELSNTPPSVKPTASTAKSLTANLNKDTTAPAKAPTHSESVTFYPPKKISPGYVKEEKEINSDSLGGDDQCDQRLNDKILPEFVDYDDELKLLNFTESALESETTLAPNESNEPFLFHLPKFLDDEKHGADFSSSNTSNSFMRRDVMFEYDDQTLSSTNSTNVSRSATERTPSSEKSTEKDHYHEPLSTTEEDVHLDFSEVYDEPQIDKPLHSKDASGRSKKRDSLKRSKREDYYNFDDFVNYDGYVYDTNGNSKDYEKQSVQQLESKETNSDVSILPDDYNWTPIKFEMFSELAKVVTETEAIDESSSELVSATSKPETTTARLSSTSNNQLETNSAEVTTEKISTADTPKKERTDTTTTPCETEPPCGTTSEPKDTNITCETRYDPRSSSTVEFQETRKESQEKTLDVNPCVDTTDDGQRLTTVGTAYIVKGPKKPMTKPSPKMYTRVYPDSVPIENEKNDTTTTTTTTGTAPKRSIILKTTPPLLSATADIRLQLLAVCEGYLEVVRLMKSQNQSFGGDVDSDLSSYCENIISQTFCQQSESSKIKNQDVNLSAAVPNKSLQNAPKKVGSLKTEPKSQDSELGDPVLKRELDNPKPEKSNDTNPEENETTEPPRWRKKPNVKKSKKRKKEYLDGSQNLSEAEDEFLKKGMSKEQVELLRLLKKRKRALLNWLFNSKEDQVQPEVEETEYFDDNDEVGNSLNVRNNSGTVRPRGAKSSGKTTKGPVIADDSMFPVYAKEYGYDKGGELRQVEVFWRKVNDVTNEKQTFKNLSVLALVLTSTIAPDIVKKRKFFEKNGYVNEDVSEIRRKKKNDVSFAAEGLQDCNNDSVAEKTTEGTRMAPCCNITVTYMNKPDPSSIIGTVINHTVNTTKYPNITRKIAGKLNKAKAIVEEYTIEFWNYAVYILPIMFSILFLFCCACCAIHILRNKKRRKKKKKKKKFESTDDEDSSDDDSEPKKKRRDKCKKSKNIWKVWKKNPNKSCSDVNDEATPAEKKSFLRFLKSKKNDKAGEGCCSVPYSALHESDGPKGDAHSESAERRELIALLEELKKIEMEQVGEKKEQKSVHVQYMVQDHEESAFKSPEMRKDYPFFSKNHPLHDSRAEEYGLYRDAELKELLPCECGYSSKKREYLRHCDFRGNEEGRCERFFNLFRNTGMHHHQYEKKKNILDNDRNFMFDKYRNTNLNEERNEAGFTIKVCDMSQFNLPPGNPNDWVGEMEHFKNQMTKKKPVRLKDDGVLCRL